MTEIETIFQKLTSREPWTLNSTVALPNRAMNFGDGLFETMVWDGMEIRFFDKHIERLKGGMEVLGMDPEAIDARELFDLLGDEFPNLRKRIRWNVYRAGSGKYTPHTSELVQSIQITEFKVAPLIKENAGVSMDIKLFPTPWSSFKSLNSLPYVLANQERMLRGLDEIILLDFRGFVSEAGSSNIFWTKGGKVFTPALSCSCINGVSRKVILEILVQKKIPFEEGEFLISDLEISDCVFISNSSGISYLGRVGFKEFSTEPLEFLELIFD